MRSKGSIIVVALTLVSSVSAAQDATRKVEGGGIHLQGWAGVADSTGDSRGTTINDGKFVKMGDGFHITTGPAAAYFNAANKASGNYAVKAKFSEAKYMGINNHPHPYGV